MSKFILIISFTILFPTTLMSNEMISNDEMFQSLDVNQDGELSMSEFDVLEPKMMNRMKAHHEANSRIESAEFSAFESSEDVQLVDDDWLPAEWSDPY